MHDVRHRPLDGAQVSLQSAHAALVLSGRTDRNGSVHLRPVPLGEYLLTVRQAGFGSQVLRIAVSAGSSPVLHIVLLVTTAHETVNVNADAEAAATIATPSLLLGQHEIDNTPNADRTNSLAIITDYVPGAYLTHDMLHIRGGHQVSWLLDGVQIPNTNIASNLGAQIDPRDMQYLEVDRGSYGAELGDRTYGVFDVNPKSGFERTREGELRLIAGSALTTDDQVSFGDHSRRGAYYASLNGNRSDYGLAPPVESASHDAENGFGAFGSFIFNRDAGNQLRLLAQLRSDFFQIPYDPDPDSYENQLYPSSGLRDTQGEHDSVLAFTWTHTLSPRAFVALSPFYHGNSTQYRPDAEDEPVGTTADRTSRYAGVQVSAHVDVAQQHLEGGLYSWGQHDRALFGAHFADSSSSDFEASAGTPGGLVEEYLSDQYKPLRGLTLTAGVRQSWFVGANGGERATSPRLGVAYQIPRLHWILRAFYGHFYQPPPLLTVSGPLVAYAQSNNTAFAPLRGERDGEHQFGLQIPWRGWVLDADTFQTEASNFLDHANIGESSIYLPVTVAGALIQAWELTLRSPDLPWHTQLHLAYSNQIAKQRGALTGGLICAPVSSPQCDVEPGYQPLDHDQRNTLNLGGHFALPLSIHAATNVYYGSGFVNGYPDPPSPYSKAYLPSHTTFDFSLSRNLTDNLSVLVNASNVSNRRVLLDNSLTFGGFHFNDPRQVYGEVRYRFHY